MEKDNIFKNIMKLSLLILDFLKAPQVVENVQSILAQNTSFEYEILVHDNSENADNAQTLKENLKNSPQVTLTIGDKNIGYTKAYNEMVSRAKGEYLGIINPDIAWRERESLQKIITFLQNHPEIGILGPRQKHKDGSIALTARKFPSLLGQMTRRTALRNIPPFKKRVEEEELLGFDAYKTQEVDWLQSSCIFLKKSFFKELGGFNEDYFLFMSDTELCKACWEKKKKVIFFGETEVEADGKRCSEGGFLDFFTKKTLRIHAKDALKYYFKKMIKREMR